VGRITQCLLRFFSPDKIGAGDPMDRAVELVRGYNIFYSVAKTPVLPPLHLKSESLDFVFAYSVFSHLSKQATVAWFSEFARVLRPGGVVFFTTRNEKILDWVSDLNGRSRSELTKHQEQLIAAYRDLNEIKRQLAGGEMWWQPIGAEGTHYGEAIIPKDFVSDTLQPILGGSWDFLDAPPEIDQAFVSMQKAHC
jgi:SAM-dependent methyltransferase